MRKGGYQIIDLGGVNLGTAESPTSVVIDGLYNKLEGVVKPILLTGIVIDNVEQKDTFVTATVIDTSIQLISGSNTFTVTSGNNKVILGNV